MSKSENKNYFKKFNKKLKQLKSKDSKQYWKLLNNDGSSKVEEDDSPSKDEYLRIISRN